MEKYEGRHLITHLLFIFVLTKHKKFESRNHWDSWDINSLAGGGGGDTKWTVTIWISKLWEISTQHSSAPTSTVLSEWQEDQINSSMMIYLLHKIYRYSSVTSSGYNLRFTLYIVYSSLQGKYRYSSQLRSASTVDTAAEQSLSITVSGKKYVLKSLAGLSPWSLAPWLCDW